MNILVMVKDGKAEIFCSTDLKAIIRYAEKIAEYEHVTLEAASDFYSFKRTLVNFVTAGVFTDVVLEYAK